MGRGAGEDAGAKAQGEDGAASGVIVPAWARLAVFAGLLGFVAYSVLFAPAIQKIPLAAGLPGWAAVLIAAAPPAAFATLLLVLLGRVARRAEQHGRLLVDTERRFRSAVEAARCGVWEWDLVEDRVYVSDRLAVMLGCEEAGVVAGEELLEKVDPDHRERVLKALKGAALHGAFDVCFRAPGAQGGRPLWIDARGQALGRPGRGRVQRHRRRGAGRHRRAAGPGARPGRGAEAARRHRERLGGLRRCGTGPGGFCCPTRTSAPGSGWSRGCCGPAPATAT